MSYYFQPREPKACSVVIREDDVPESAAKKNMIKGSKSMASLSKTSWITCTNWIRNQKKVKFVLLLSEENGCFDQWGVCSAVGILL